MTEYDIQRKNAIESTHSTTTETILACPAPGCERLKLELSPLKIHWTVTHSDELGEFPGAIEMEAHE